MNHTNPASDDPQLWCRGVAHHLLRAEGLGWQRGDCFLGVPECELICTVGFQPNGEPVMAVHWPEANRNVHRWTRSDCEMAAVEPPWPGTALPDQCLHSAEADVRPPRRKSGFDQLSDIAPQSEPKPRQCEIDAPHHRERGNCPRPSRP